MPIENPRSELALPWYLHEERPDHMTMYWDAAPRYLLRDCDAVYAFDFRHRVAGLGITEVLTARRSGLQRIESYFKDETPTRTASLGRLLTRNRVLAKDRRCSTTAGAAWPSSEKPPCSPPSRMSARTGPP